MVTEAGAAAEDQMVWVQDPEPAAISPSVRKASTMAAASCAGQSMRRPFRGPATARPRVRSSTARPIGTLTRKIERHPPTPTSAPPTIGPTATAAPLMPAQIEMARARGAGSG
jgi:hypothetical protein